MHNLCPLTYRALRGIHNGKKAVQQRVIYLFSRFIKDARRYIDKSFVPAILNGISVSGRCIAFADFDLTILLQQDALPIVAVLPEVENPGDDVLAKATTGSQPLDTHIYLYESVGTLISLVRDPAQQNPMLQAAFGPLVQELASAVQRSASGVRPELVQVLQVHHVIMCIGAFARGFPEPGEQISPTAPSWVATFEQPSQAVLQALESYKAYRIIRDAVSGVVSLRSSM